MNVRQRWRTRNATYKNSTKCTGECGSGEKESSTVILLVTLIPHAHIEDTSRDEPTLHETEEEAGRDESREVLGDAREGGDCTPGESEGGQPEPWGREFEHDIARNLKQDQANKVDGYRGGKLFSGLF